MPGPHRSRVGGGAEGEGARAKFVKALHDAGAPLLVGTDSPNPFITPGYAIHDELDSIENGYSE